MKTLLTIGTSHVQSGHNYLDERTSLCIDPNQPDLVRDHFFKTWPGYLQSQLTDTRVFNLGVSGHGIDSIMVRTMLAIKEFKPDTILLELPPLTRYSLWHGLEPNITGSVRDISHVAADNQYHFCHMLVEATVLNPPSKNEYNDFRDTWLVNLNTVDWIAHQAKFSMLCDYIVSQGVELLAFSINNDSFNSFEDADEYAIPYRKYFPQHDNCTVFNLQTHTSKHIEYEFSTDGRGHAAPTVERWWVDNIFVPNLK